MYVHVHDVPIKFVILLYMCILTAVNGATMKAPPP